MNLKEHLRRNFLLAFPVMLSQLGHVMVGVVDSMMVGHVSSESLAAASLANGIFVVFMTFGIGLSYALTPLVAEADGAGDHSKNTEFVKHSFLVNVIYGLVIFFACWPGAIILNYLNQPPEVVELAIPYLRIIALSLLPLMVFQTFRQFAEGLSLTSQAMYISVSANLFNIVLNYWFIFGKLGLPPMGLDGAGWATLIARVLMAGAMAAYVLYGKRFRLFFEHVNWSKFIPAITKRIMRIGVPIGFQFIFEVGAFSFAVIMIGWIGEKEMAAHQVAISLASLTYMMASGIAAAATIRVGNQLGRRDFQTLKEAGLVSFVMGVVFMSAMAGIFLMTNQLLPVLYVDEADVIRLASELIIIAAFFQISDGIQVIGLGCLRGLSDVKYPTLITLVSYWIIGLPAGYLLAFPLGIGTQGVWYGLLIGLSVAAILLFYRFWFLTGRLKRKESVLVKF